MHHISGSLAIAFSPATRGIQEFNENHFSRDNPEGYHYQLAGNFLGPSMQSVLGVQQGYPVAGVGEDRPHAGYSFGQP